MRWNQTSHRAGRADLPTITDPKPTLEELEALRLELQHVERQYLSVRGWKYTCNTLGSSWLWERKMPDGRTLLVNQATAMWMSEILDEAALARGRGETQ